MHLPHGSTNHVLGPNRYCASRPDARDSSRAQHSSPRSRWRKIRLSYMAESPSYALGIIMTLARSPLIPVGAMGDPVPVGIVANIARPEGNITGVSSVAGPEIWGERLQVLREAARRHRRWDSSVRVNYGACRQQMCCGKMPSNWGSLSWAHPSRARSEAKNIAAYWEQWRRNMSTRSSSVIKQRT